MSVRMCLCVCVCVCECVRACVSPTSLTVFFSIRVQLLDECGNQSALCGTRAHYGSSPGKSTHSAVSPHKLGVNLILHAVYVSNHARSSAAEGHNVVE